MIMIIAIIYFLSDEIFDQQLKITFRKTSATPPLHPQKFHSLRFYSPLPPPPPLKKKNSVIASPPLFAEIKTFLASSPLAEWTLCWA